MLKSYFEVAFFTVEFLLGIIVGHGQWLLSAISHKQGRSSRYVSHSVYAIVFVNYIHRAGVTPKAMASIRNLTRQWCITTAPSGLPLDSLVAARLVHGFAIIAQTNQQQACRTLQRYISQQRSSSV